MIVITGGPGAGKTAFLESAKRIFCQHVVILPEAASILFSGGFLRRGTDSGRRSAQRAIYHVQRELEQIVLDESQACLILCDRGTIDGLAYWPGEAADFWKEVGSSLQQEYSRYAQVIHLKTPPEEDGYNYQNPVRVESPLEAAAIDARILQAWQGHPNFHSISSSPYFLDKISQATQLIRDQVPPCCQLKP